MSKVPQTFPRPCRYGTLGPRVDRFFDSFSCLVCIYFNLYLLESCIIEDLSFVQIYNTFPVVFHLLQFHSSVRVCSKNLSMYFVSKYYYRLDINKYNSSNMKVHVKIPWSKLNFRVKGNYFVYFLSKKLPSQMSTNFKYWSKKVSYKEFDRISWLCS